MQWGGLACSPTRLHCCAAPHRVPQPVLGLPPALALDLQEPPPPFLQGDGCAVPPTCCSMAARSSSVATLVMLMWHPSSAGTGKSPSRSCRGRSSRWGGGCGQRGALAQQPWRTSSAAPVASPHLHSPPCAFNQPLLGHGGQVGALLLECLHQGGAAAFGNVEAADLRIGVHAGFSAVPRDAGWHSAQTPLPASP